MEKIINQLIKFNRDRNWNKFHTPKNLGIALSVEVAELNELMQWKTQFESFTLPLGQVADELADIMIYTLILCYKFGLNPEKIISEKIVKNAKKYPVTN